MSLDVTVAWDRPASSGESEHWLSLSIRGVQGVDSPMALAILVDTSTSMVGDRLVRACATVEAVVRAAQPIDRALVLGFGSSVVRAFEGAGGSEIGDALRSLAAGGKTRLDLALDEAERWLRSQNGRTHVLLLTDGDPTSAEGRRVPNDPFVERMRLLGRDGLRFTVVGLGSTDGYDAAFLRAIADAAGGVAVVGVQPALLRDRTLSAMRAGTGDAAVVHVSLKSSELSVVEAWRVEPRVQPITLDGAGAALPIGEEGALLLRVRLVQGLGARRGERVVGTLTARQHGGAQANVPLVLTMVAPGSSERMLLNEAVDRLRVKVELARTAQVRASADEWDDQIRLTRQLADLASRLDDPRATRRIQAELNRLDGGASLSKDDRETAVDALRGGEEDG